MQHEVVPRLSVEVQYARRWYGNFRVQDDRAVGPGDYDRFSITTPSDGRLPDGGGYRLTAYDLKPTASTTQNNFVTLADRFGTQTEHFDGVNISVNARLQNGLVVQGGTGLGRVVTDDCEIVEQLPETLHQFVGNNTRSFVFTARPLERCRENRGLRTRIQGLAAYTIPKIDVQVAGTFQNLPGVGVNATPTLSPPPPTWTPLPAGPFRSFNIVDAGELYVERLNQLDFRVAKIFRYGTTRTSINFDLSNIFNANSVIAENSTYTAPPIPAWRTRRRSSCRVSSRSARSSTSKHEGHEESSQVATTSAGRPVSRGGASRRWMDIHYGRAPTATGRNCSCGYMHQTHSRKRLTTGELSALR